MNSIMKYPELVKVPAKQETKKPLIVTVTSGKGGVGKTLTSVNLAVAARKMSKSVLLFDGDLGLANVDVVLGLKATHSINDVLEGSVSIEDILLDGPLGVKVIPSGSGVTKLSNLSAVQRINLREKLSALTFQPDIMIIDTGAGIADNVLHFNLYADKILVVTTPEPHAMTDAYALMKVMSEEYGKNQFNLLVNQVRSEDEGLRVYSRIADVAKRFINAKITYTGHVPMDSQIQRNVMLRRAASDSVSMTLAGQAWNEIALTAFSDWCAPDTKVSKGSWQHIMAPSLSSVSSSVQTRA